MATRDDLRRIARSLPGCLESGDRFGFYVEVKGKAKGIAWLWAERIDPKKPRVLNEGVLAILTPGLAAKEIWLSSNPDVIFTEDHYNGFPAVLVKLELADPAELEDLMTDAWKAKAPKSVVADFEAKQSKR